MILPKNLPSAEVQYLDLLRTTMEHGHDIRNDRTGMVCRTVTVAVMYNNVGGGEFTLTTTRKSYWRKAIRELCGYFRGFNSAAQFRDLGTDSWDINANETRAWLDNPHRKGTDDIGLVYGGVAKRWPTHDGHTMDLFKKVYTNLKAGVDDRGEIVTFWNPGLFELGALRPCMYSHTFTLLGDTLHMTSTQRSSDAFLGVNWNMMQCYVFLAVMAKITGHKPGWVKHDHNNFHIYENHFEQVTEQLSRDPYEMPTIKLSDRITDWDYVVNHMTDEDFEVIGYQSHPPISGKMSA
jgi:thymidylate synthase